MRKIIDKATIVIFILVVTAVTWVIVNAFLNASANRDGNAASITIRQIRDSELLCKPKYGRYLTLDELIKEQLVPVDVQTANDSYNFQIDLKENGFIVHALPKGNKASKFSIDDKEIVTY